MSHLVARIMLVIFMIPAAALVYCVAVVFGFRTFSYGLVDRDNITFTLAGAVTWIALAAAWVFLWWKSVSWSRSRIWQTIGAAGICTAVGLVLGAAVHAIEPGFGAFVGSVAAPLLWLMSTTVIWRETAGERMQRMRKTPGAQVVCPTCGYNLAGLSEARCPECGGQFTLDELFAAQPSPAVDAEVH
jgi:uncharacterized membrane protein YfcA